MANERSEIERNSRGHPALVQDGQPSRTYIPHSDIIEREDALVLLLDMPGVEEKSLNIDLEKDTLTISGQINVPKCDKHQLLYGEYGGGWYKRSFALADWFDSEKVQAELKDGVLTLTLPKSEKVKPKKITVRAA